MAYQVETRVAGSKEHKYSEKELVQVHVNLPKLLWQAIDGIANVFGTTKTNVVVRALNKEIFFSTLLKDEPGARVVVEHKDGHREYITFV